MAVRGEWQVGGAHGDGAGAGACCGPLASCAALLFTVCRFNPPMEFICLEVTHVKFMADVCD